MSDYFPTDVTLEILQRLPVKSLIRFTAVCKSWRSLITAPSFVSSHLSIAKTRPTRLLRRADKVTRTEHYSLLYDGIVNSSLLDIPFKSTFANCPIVGSCNGLLCLFDGIDGRSPPKRIIVWNPTIRNYVVLPEPAIDLDEHHHFVLGFGSVGDDSKLVRLVYSKRFKVPPLPRAEIYSLKEGSWRRIQGFTVMLVAFVHEPSCQALLSGVVHWTAMKQLHPTCCSSILTFNFDSEEFGEILLPSQLSKEHPEDVIVSLVAGSLGTIHIDEGEDLADVWIMKETWTKLYRVNLFDNSNGMARVVALWSKTEALVELSNELGFYDSESQLVKKLGISGGLFTFHLVDDFVESLVLIRGEDVVAKEDVYVT